MIAAISTPPAHVRTLTLADLRQTVGVSSPQISPDGRRVLIYVRRNDYDKDRGVVDLVLVNVRTRAARTLLHDARDLSGVAWSPDGSKIAYAARAGDQPQVFILPMDGGEPVQLTHEKDGVGDLEWRPDGRAIAYVKHTEPPNEKAIEAHADQFTVTDEPWTAQEAPDERSDLRGERVRRHASTHRNRRLECRRRLHLFGRRPLDVRHQNNRERPTDALSRARDHSSRCRDGRRNHAAQTLPNADRSHSLVRRPHRIRFCKSEGHDAKRSGDCKSRRIESAQRYGADWIAT